MGVPQIWELIREHQQEPTPRYPVGVALPGKRIAIDAYHILFECGFFNRTENIQDLSKPILNLTHRLKELVALDLWFLLVFDGCDKPTKIRRTSKQGKSTGQEYINDSSDVLVDSVSDPILNVIHQILNKLNISWVTTTGEGEAYCCYLQSNLHVVDYVWSNDSDCFIFGGDKILKNYSRQFEDVGVTSEYNKYFDKQKNNYITLVDYQDLVDNHLMLNKQQLLLYSILLGADYNTGVKGLGKVKSLKIVEHKEPNFGQLFHDIFNDIDDTNKLQKEVEYERFQKTVYQYCQKHTKSLFGKNYGGSLLSTDKDNFEGWPSIDIVLHYFHPSMNKVFNDSVLEPTYSNINRSQGYDRIDFLALKDLFQKYEFGNITNFDRWFHNTMHEMFLLKYILYGQNDGVDAETLRHNVKITEEKNEFVNNINRDISYWKVRYNSFLRGVIYRGNEGSPSKRSPTRSPVRSPKNSPTKSPTKSPTRSPTKRQIDILEYPYGMWIAKNCIPDNHPLVLDFQDRETMRLEQELQKKQAKNKNMSPKKRLNQYKQSTTLDSFFKRSSTPILSSARMSESPQPIIMNKLNGIRKRLFVENDETESDTNNESTAILPKAQQQISTVPNHSDTEDTDDSLIILEEISVLPRTPFERPVTTISPTKRHKQSNNIVNSIEYNDNLKIRTPEKNRIRELPPRVNSNISVLDEMFNSNATGVIESPKKPPFLARTDTFGSTTSKRSILDDINCELDEMVKEMNENDTDSTLSTVSDNDDSAKNRIQEDAFNESDDQLFDL
ncbi:similar to Saccharomyces cerevisiae YER041W YEN1 Holliday junction resolvase [Maudiozyma saulgeensis]|uniref:Similar to Saccharomyces cerevisiae YER041W YEN1 Holliday junction resolvase n=1 Tax=Maudiozyma saulgeensis TaxID=1789683 RepID=A0A1X7RAN6_9SACH|nr:similar to Saccharomyces cerevisiae YER041W YEN1 Holliday junction resolvase [Kazachstania saulgeensis]